VDGKQWSPSLANPHTKEWQELSIIVTNELEELYRNSELGSSFDRIEVEAFSKGSVIVDYYVVFHELPAKVSTQDLKDIVEYETRKEPGSNMLGESLRIDPKYSDFIVVGTEEAEPSTEIPEEDMLLPPWAVAVVCIGMASVAFVIICGVSMLAKRRRMSRASKSGKQALSLTEEMVYEMNRSGSGYSGLDAAYHNYGMDGMESWKSDKYSQGRFKRGSSSSSGGGYVTRGELSAERGPHQSGLYDSWKTEWNPTFRDYQTSHYPHPTSSYMTKGGRRPSYEDDF